MFGYVIANRPEMKIKDFDTYRGFYCGLCKELKKRYGRAGQMTLSYDMTFLVLLLTGLYEPDTLKEYRRCMLHPLSRHLCIHNEYTVYAADMNIVFGYYKMMDDWQDERRLNRRMMAALLKRRYRRVTASYPDKAKKILDALKGIRDCEERREENMDKAAGYFGDILAELFVYRQDEWEEPLRKMGYFLGKFIYLMDAYEDLEKDAESGGYNPFLPLFGSKGCEETCRGILTAMMAESARAFERLPILECADVLRNILYSGVWTRYEVVAAKRRQQNETMP